VVAADDSGPLPTAEEIVTEWALVTSSGKFPWRDMPDCGGTYSRTTSPQTRRNARSSARRPGRHKTFRGRVGRRMESSAQHVLRKMLESESDTFAPRHPCENETQSENYDFEVIGTEPVATVRPTSWKLNRNERRSLPLSGTHMGRHRGLCTRPRRSNPAKNPSFWTKSTHFVQVYQKSGPLWFPLSTQSVTEAHILAQRT